MTKAPLTPKREPAKNTENEDEPVTERAAPEDVTAYPSNPGVGLPQAPAPEREEELDRVTEDEPVEEEAHVSFQSGKGGAYELRDGVRVRVEGPGLRPKED
jgi:hypothetical protein